VSSSAARRTTTCPALISTSIVTVNRPEGCSMSRSSDGPAPTVGLVAIAAAVEPGSTHAVATDTAPSTPMASCTDAG